MGVWSVGARIITWEVHLGPTLVAVSSRWRKGCLATAVGGIRIGVVPFLFCNSMVSLGESQRLWSLAFVIRRGGVDIFPFQ